MARYAGKDADFQVAGVQVKGCNKWSLDDDAPEIDVTGFDTISTRGEFISGRPNTTVAFSGHWDTAEAKLYSAGVGVPPVISAGQAGVAMKLYLFTGGPFFDVIVNVTTMHYEADEGGVVDWNGTGRVTTLTAYPV